MSIETLASELLAPGPSSAGVKKRLSALREVRRAEDDGEWLGSILDFSEQACGQLEKAASILSETRSVLHDVGEKIGKAPESDPPYGELLKSAIALQSQIASFSRTALLFRKESLDRKSAQDGRLDEITSLMEGALSKMLEAAGPVENARKLAEVADRRARTGLGFRAHIRRRFRSAELLKSVSVTHSGLLRLIRSTRTTVSSQEHGARDAVRRGSFE